MLPVILLSCGTQTGALSAQRRLSALYGEALAHAGLASAAFTGGSARALAARFDGLVLTGGGDLTPALFGQAPDPRSAPPDPRRDAEELALTAAFCAARKPVLGVCRGIQVLAVYFGGDLIQHLDGHADGAVHTVSAVPGSTLHTLFGASFPVNSYHHQAVRAPGPVLRVTARAADGTVEGLEHPRLPVIGVQWHPERMVHGLCEDTPCDQGPLFAWLRRQVTADGTPRRMETENI